MYRDDWLMLADRSGTSHTPTIVTPRHGMRTGIINPMPSSFTPTNLRPTSTLSSYLLFLPNEPDMGTPIRVDPFRTIPWQSDEAREVPIDVGRNNAVHTEYVWTTVRQLRSGDRTLAPVRSGPDAEGGTSADAVWSASPEERPPTYSRNEGRRSRGTQTLYPRGHARGSRPSQAVRQPVGPSTPTRRLHTNENACVRVN